MTYKAKKLWAGCYTYRGYRIEEMSRYGDTGYGTTWAITNEAMGETEPALLHAANTLSDAKGWIDYWADK